MDVVPLFFFLHIFLVVVETLKGDYAMKENCSSCNGQNQWSGRGRSMGMTRGCGNEMRRQNEYNSCNMNETGEKSGCGCSNMNEMRGRSGCGNSNMNGMRRRGNNIMSNRNDMRERSGCIIPVQEECSCNMHPCNREIKPVDSMMPGMGYVPWQKFDRVLDAREGFVVGTIFEELVLPFCGRPCAGKGMSCR